MKDYHSKISPSLWLLDDNNFGSAAMSSTNILDILWIADQENSMELDKDEDY